MQVFLERKRLLSSHLEWCIGPPWVYIDRVSSRYTDRVEAQQSLYSPDRGKVDDRRPTKLNKVCYRSDLCYPSPSPSEILRVSSVDIPLANDGGVPSLLLRASPKDRNYFSSLYLTVFSSSSSSSLFLFSPFIWSSFFILSGLFFVLSLFLHAAKIRST